MSRLPAASLRTKILGISLVGAMLPLALVGVWLNRNTQRLGEELLEARLDSTLIRVSHEVGRRWIGHRTALLDIAQDTLVQRVMTTQQSALRRDGAVPLPSGRSFAGLRAATQLVLLRDLAGQPSWILAADAAGLPVLVPASDSMRVLAGFAGDVISVTMPVGAARRRALGEIEARFRTSEIVPFVSGSASGAGVVVTVVDRRSGVVVAPLPFDAALLRHRTFTWGGEEWLSAARLMEDPYIELLAAAPLTGFTLPFRRAARTGVLALVVVGLLAFAIVTLLTRRVTHTIVELADAADAVSRGDLDRQVPRRTRDEVGRLAGAFNLMTESLRRTLAELSQRQAVAAVGEFASALAHEIRNPLSAIRLNLQHIDESLEADAKLRAPVTRSLSDIVRLENTVAGALRLARTGRMHMELVPLDEPLNAAARSAAPEIARRGVAFEMSTASEPRAWVKGNAVALEQVFLNLILNATQAAGKDGRVRVSVSPNGERTTVTIWDSGPGFAPQALERAFDPFFTTKPEGSGLGLTVARRIAIAHGGSVDIDPSGGKGTSIHVRLPSSNGATHAS